MDRNSIINLHKKGLKNTEIAKALRINRSTVWRTLKRFGGPSNRIGRGRIHLSKVRNGFLRMFPDFGIK